ncbi:MocR-like pyridoxine biosynthesis transcription factor PdxR [Fusobacterium sp. oral taxon 203]|uniref:MocR-like pyridoxine biosynthesis transcription factor PdxR n=1 Tax=Fusobacterium sp. oral taxon 203 TaxID=671211 RepID=UPI000B9288E9|nr:PLP-dependent aminotransferase family protein [Fusobacterium sp. oral taxon 203]ASS38642.1 GntR family transcriptional regulator [Fusobacterium sp. oral taxon 203]
MIILNLDNKSKIPLYIQIYNEIKKLIQTKILDANEKLPSKKDFMDYYNISQNTIQNALYLLLEEGYISSIERKGYFVSDIENLIVHNVKIENKRQYKEKKKIHYDFSYSGVDSKSLAKTIFKRITKDVYDEENEDLLFQGHIQGDLLLRKSICEYLSQSRGFKVEAEQLIISSGTEYLFYIIFKLFNNKIYGLETPCHKMFKELFLTNDVSFKAISLDESGIMIEDLKKYNINIAYVTPSHQFPTGVIMGISRRTELLNWANENPNRYIVEDDYDSEFKYTGRPIPALKATDVNDKVIYLGSFSKSISPAIRVSYLVLPKALLNIYQKKLPYFICPVPTLNQKILYKFIKDGYFVKHINKMRTLYKKKREYLVNTIKINSSKILDKEISIQGADAGLHLVIKLNKKINEKMFLKECLENSLQLYSLEEYYLEEIYNETSSFLLGYANLANKEIDEGILLLLQILKKYYV